MTDNPIYPGHAITLACQIAQAFPSYEAAGGRTEHGCPTALSCNAVHGAGGNVYAALEVLHMLRSGLALEDVLQHADGEWRSLCAGQGWPKEPQEACDQARRYLERIDLARWVAGQF